MGADDLRHVTSVQQRSSNNTVVAYVQTDSFKPDQKVEVSVILIQGNDTYITFNGKADIPPSSGDPTQPAVLPVELPATELDATQGLTVVARITEVWPTVLQPDPEKEGITDPDIKAVWKYYEPGDPGSPSSGDGGGGVTATPQL